MKATRSPGCCFGSRNSQPARPAPSRQRIEAPEAAGRCGCRSYWIVLNLSSIGRGLAFYPDELVQHEVTDWKWLKWLSTYGDNRLVPAILQGSPSDSAPINAIEVRPLLPTQTPGGLWFGLWGQTLWERFFHRFLRRRCWYWHCVRDSSLCARIHLDFITEHMEIARRKKSQERSAGDLREIGLEAIAARRSRTSATKGVSFIKV